MTDGKRYTDARTLALLAESLCGGSTADGCFALIDAITLIAITGHKPREMVAIVIAALERRQKTMPAVGIAGAIAAAAAIGEDKLS